MLKGVAAVAALMVTAATLIACSPSAPPPSVSSDAALDPTEKTPAFTGPYAAEFAEAWRETDLDFVRDVIRDERITDQEWVEMSTRRESCFARYGMTFLGFEPEGGYAVNPGPVDGDRAQDLLAECEEESGERWLNYLQNSARINPDNVDLSELIAACLVRAGAVPPGYTADHYRRDSADGEIPLTDPVGGRQAHNECSSDPLDLVGTV